MPDIEHNTPLSEASTPPEAGAALRSYDDLSPEEQREADEQMREEFEAQLASEPMEPEESILDGTHEMYTDIEEQNIADFERKHSARNAEAPKYEVIGQREDDAAKAERDRQQKDGAKLSKIMSYVTGKPIDYYVGTSSRTDYDAEPGVGPGINPQLYGAPEERDEEDRDNDDNQQSENMDSREPIAVRLTEEQTKLLLSAEYPNNTQQQTTALYNVYSGNEHVNVMNESVALDYSEDQKSFFATLDKDEKPAVDAKLTQLQAEKERAKPNLERAKQPPERQGNAILRETKRL